MKAGCMSALRCFPPDYQTRCLRNLHNRLSHDERQALIAGISNVVRVIQKNWTPAEKATVLYHALTQYLRYDHIAGQLAKRGDDPEEEQSFTYLGALFNGTAVCCGIAQLYAILCQSCGIPCRVVEGYAGSKDQEGLHSWVQICLPDSLGNPISYHCDPTWDLLESNPSRNFHYFLRSDAYFETHYHQWYFAIGADLGWHKFDRCPNDAQIPKVPQAAVRQVVAQLEKIRLDQPYVLKKSKGEFLCV